MASSMRTEEEYDLEEMEDSSSWCEDVTLFVVMLMIENDKIRNRDCEYCDKSNKRQTNESKLTPYQQ